MNMYTQKSTMLLLLHVDEQMKKMYTDISESGKMCIIIGL